MDEEKKKTLIEVTEEVLKEDVRSRKDTKWFVIQILRKLGIKIWIDYKELEKLPSFESILRTKREIQNKRNIYNDENFIKEEGVTYEKCLKQ